MNGDGELARSKPPSKTCRGGRRTAPRLPFEAGTRQLLDEDFMEWHLSHGHQGNQLSQAGTFEISDGVLFVTGAGDEFENDAATDEFAQFVTEFAARVARIAPTT